MENEASVAAGIQLRFDIKDSVGMASKVVVESTSARLGHAAHCDIRMPLDQAAYEHADVFWDNGDLYIEPLVDEPPITVGGVVVKGRTKIGADKLIDIGAMQMAVAVLGESSALSGKKGPSLLIVGSLVLGIPLIVFLQLGKSGPAVEAAPRLPPNIFLEGLAQCPHHAADQASAFAEERFALAETRRERYPFVPRDGLVAVALYDLSAACFRVAGDDASATAATTSAAELRDTIMTDFRSRVLRLEYSVRNEDNELAAADIIVLRQLVDGKRGAYVEWLSGVEAKVRTALEKKKKK